jgi:multidrug efflux system outer membrane protein
MLEEPTSWRETLETQGAVDAGWWKQFGDSTLDGLIDLALANNQDLKTAIARVDQFQAQLLIARSKLYPQLSGDALAQRQKISTSVTALPPGIKQVFNLFGLLFNASYLVDLWGEVRSGAEAAYHAWLSAIEARRVVVLGLVSSVASAYIQLRQFDQQLIIAFETLKAREDSLYLAKIRFELGLTSELQVEQAISEVEEAKVQMENFEILTAETENLLSFLIGSPSREIPRGLMLDQTTMPPSVPAVLPSELLNQRPDIKAAEERLIAKNADIGVAKAKFFPQINLSGAAGAESVAMNQLFKKASKIWEFGSTVMQEIFTGFELTGNLDRTRAEKEEALHSYLSTVLNGFKEVNDAIVAHTVYLEQVETEKTRVEALEKYLHLSDLRYKEGQTDYLTFLDAERQLFRGLLEFESAKANSFLSYIQIYQALGGGWVIEADKQAVGQDG